MKKVRYKEKNLILVLIPLLVLGILFSMFLVSAVDTPDSVEAVANETKTTGSGQMINISGGYISKLNVSANAQNPHWKAFVGWVHGSFTLDDSSGNTIYDWTMTSIGGEIFATRIDSTIGWSSVECADLTSVENENTILHHTNDEDNISATFDFSGTHNTLVVGGQSMAANSCPTLNTHVSDLEQDSTFEEVILKDTNEYLIFTTILEENSTGFDGSGYDFQMLVPENGSESWSGSIPYYIYVELS